MGLRRGKSKERGLEEPEGSGLLRAWVVKVLYGEVDEAWVCGVWWCGFAQGLTNNTTTHAMRNTHGNPK